MIKQLANPPPSLPRPRPCPPLDKLSPRPGEEQASKIIDQYVNEYREALVDDVISKVRHFVTNCRASGQRREEFTAIVRKGNEVDGFEKLGVVGLLKDVDTQWSSLFQDD